MANISAYKIHGIAGVRDRLSKNRILIIAVAVSIVLHIFWLSVVKVVFVPSKTRSGKFSKVSFIGPILESGMFEVRIEPRQRDFLERRYLKSVEGLPAAPSEAWMQNPYTRGSADTQFTRINDAQLTELIADAVSGPKLEPDYGSE